MEKLKELQEKLKKRAAFQLDVLDCVTGAIFEKGVNQAFLEKHYQGSLTNYVQDVHKKGLQKFQLLQKLKNGSSTKPGGGPSVTIDFMTATGSATATNGGTVAPPQTSVPAGLNGAFGLGMPEILDGYAAKRENEMLKEQIRQLQQDYKEERESKQKWREKATKYENEININEVEKRIVKEPSFGSGLIEGFAKDPAGVLNGLSSMVNSFVNKSQGLNSPQQPEPQTIDPLENYSEMQRALCETIGQLPDALCADLATIIARIAEPDEPFKKELIKLLKTQNLKKVE